MATRHLLNSNDSTSLGPGWDGPVPVNLRQTGLVVYGLQQTLATLAEFRQQIFKKGLA
jgi:hypothetical protein